MNLLQMEPATKKQYTTQPPPNFLTWPSVVDRIICFAVVPPIKRTQTNVCYDFPMTLNISIEIFRLQALSVLSGTQATCPFTVQSQTDMSIMICRLRLNQIDFVCPLKTNAKTSIFD